MLFITSPAWAVSYCSNGTMGGAWKFDETSGTLMDCTSNANNGTGTSVTEGVPGKYNNAVKFLNSNGSYVGVTASGTINNLPSISMGAWINPASAGQAGSLCSGSTIIGKTNGTNGPELCFNSSGRIQVLLNWSGGAVNWETTTTPITLGSWQHIAFTYSYSSTGNVPVIYYNGVAQPIAINSGGPSGSQGSDSGNRILVGNQTTAAGGFDGPIDEPFWSNTTLSAQDITNIMTNGLDGTQNPPSSGTTIRQATIRNALII